MMRRATKCMRLIYQCSEGCSSAMFSRPREVGRRQIIHYRAVGTIIAMTPSNEITKRRAKRLQLLDFLIHPREVTLGDRLDVGAGPLAVLVQ